MEFPCSRDISFFLLYKPLDSRCNICQDVNTSSTNGGRRRSGAAHRIYGRSLLFLHTGVAMKQNIKKAKRHLTKLRELVSKRKHPLTEVKEEKVLETLRKTREELWDHKFASRS